MSLSKRTRFRVLTRDRFTCRYCGRSAPAVVLHIDHIHPASRGGSNDESNLVTACVDCNGSKSDKILPLFPVRIEPAYTPTSIFEQQLANATAAFESLARGVEPRFGDPRG